jgi:hypothetical protein
MIIRPSNEPATPVAAPGHRPKLHPDVLKLGVVSFLTDLSSEMIFSVFAKTIPVVTNSMVPGLKTQLVCGTFSLLQLSTGLGPFRRVG